MEEPPTRQVLYLLGYCLIVDIWVVAYVRIARKTNTAIQDLNDVVRTVPWRYRYRYATFCVCIYNYVFKYSIYVDTYIYYFATVVFFWRHRNRYKLSF